jgi:hypothetical protein
MRTTDWRPHEELDHFRSALPLEQQGHPPGLECEAAFLGIEQDASRLHLKYSWDERLNFILLRSASAVTPPDRCQQLEGNDALAAAPAASGWGEDLVGGSATG